MTLTIQIPSLPIPWQRSRSVGPHSTKRRTPEDLRVWQEVVREAAREEMDLQDITGLPCEGPFRVIVTIAARDSDVFRANKMDGDNIVKGILDALNNVIWSDDNSKCIPHIRYNYQVIPSFMPESTHTSIEITLLSDILHGPAHKECDNRS